MRRQPVNRRRPALGALVFAAPATTICSNSGGSTATGSRPAADRAAGSSQLATGDPTISRSYLLPALAAVGFAHYQKAPTARTAAIRRALSSAAAKGGDSVVTATLSSYHQCPVVTNNAPTQE